MKDLLRVERTDRAGIAVLAVSGELDLASAPVLKRHLDAVDRRGARVVVDLSGCSFIDSTGLSVLVDAAGRDGPGIALAAPSPQVRRVFEITAVESLVPVFETLAQAGAGFDSPARGNWQAPHRKEGVPMLETPETPVIPGEETPEEGGGEEEGGEGGEGSPEVPQP